MGMEQWFLEYEKEVRELARALFLHPETAGEERYAMESMAAFLERQGFWVERKSAGLPGAFTAVWENKTDEKGPSIGFLAEYDALPGLGQEAVPFCCQIDGNGHGCGHNLLGVGAAAAGCALKAELEKTGMPGNIVIYGCPEEEICRGKIVMCQAGCFDGLDCAVSWHPWDKNQVSEDVFQAMVSRKFRFFGTSSHAASSPQQGRSALDAAEIMSVCVNYLREHVSSDVRIHYVYTSAGEKPNIVPDFAEVWYYIRAENEAVMRDAERRVILAAKGAGIATETRMETEELIASPETRLNAVLSQAMFEVLKECGVPSFTKEELAFAEELHKNLGLSGIPVSQDIQPLYGISRPMTGSTDVSAVSQLVPVVTLNTVCQPNGAPGHHWGITASAGSDFGMRGMLHAAWVMAKFGCRFCGDTELRKAAKECFLRN